MSVQNFNELTLFGRKIRELRSARSISQEELAWACELDRTYISGIERGVRNPSLKNIIKIANALNIKPSTLFEDF
ncbi:helix-turn-helix domain-containing protein [Yersinia ruckeri]|uniref:helix-turn-helix domain-containing protein n=1 Tax=Yersinia ruckeri TaxID=29486 RepID=UPI001F432517|nr:helix-turn-helix transcriptional regulator [Yersinia ruckeri]UIM99696.1 helix-turn-helix transcriptional regulator [Yersinia ruckeri]